MSLSSPSIDQPKLLKLILVLFKEAALDSPTFRALANHITHLIDLTEQWLDGLLRFIKKYPQYYADFRDFLYTLVDLLSPPFLADGIIDQDYTLAALQCTRKGILARWNTLLKLFSVADADMSTLLVQAKNDIKAYKEVRKAFDVAQSKYDLFLLRHASQLKTKEPSALREDAFQLSEVRRLYIHALLELCVSQGSVQRALDSALVGLAGCFWGPNEPPQDDPLFNTYNKIRQWAKACGALRRALARDMAAARKQIEELAVQQFAPLRDLAAHAPGDLSNAALLEGPPVKEKHGWVFVRTQVGKPARQVWVRRWAFVKNGMFGLLNLAPLKTYVQESDKIGVLLCNVRPANSEERRFCFEIKTIDTSVVCQAETLEELKQWLQVFAGEKKRAIETSAQPPFLRLPPEIAELALSATTLCDVELTSGSVENRGNSVVTSESIARLVNEFNRQFSPYFTDFLPEGGVGESLTFPEGGALEEPIINTPISTRMTKLSVVSSAFFKPTIVPSAANANVWGSVNWGMYYLVEENKLKKDRESSEPKDGKNRVANYPQYFTRSMITQDIQMRAIFRNALKPGELCLVLFRCIWSPNLTQELAGRCFVTADNIYFYMNSMGFVLLLTKNLDEIVSVESLPKKLWDTLKVYAVDGLNMRAKIFLDDAEKIAKKLSILIDNKTTVSPLSPKELATQIMQIDEEPLLSPVVAPVSAEVPLLSGVSKGLKEYKDDFLDQYNRLILDSTVPLPAKALFHVLFGDKLPVFKETLTMIVDGGGFEMLPWRVYSDGKLQRKVLFELLTNSKNLPIRDKRLLDSAYTGILLGTMSEVHTVENLVDNEYYDIKTERLPMQLPLGGPFEVKARFVIRKTDTGCRLRIFSSLEFLKQRPTSALARRVYGSFFASEARKISGQVSNAVAQIGEHGKTNKAVKLYGQLGVDQEAKEYSTKSEEVVSFGFLLFAKMMLKVSLIRVINLLIWTSGATFGALGSFFSALSMHKFLVTLLLISCFGNVWLTGKATRLFWVVKRTEKMLSDYTRIAHDSISSQNEGRGLMQRAVYLRDIVEMIEQGKGFLSPLRESACFKEFRNASFVANFERLALEAHFLEQHYGGVASLEVAMNLQSTLQDIGIKRNELLINLKILERVEREIAIGEWKNWLASENQRCDFVQKEIVGRVGEEKLPGVEELLKYCESCKEEMGKSLL